MRSEPELLLFEMLFSYLEVDIVFLRLCSEVEYSFSDYSIFFLNYVWKVINNKFYILHITHNDNK